MCSCQMSAETTQHFLVDCNLYTMIRNDLFLEINPILESKGLRNLRNDLLTKLLLYGNDVLSDDDNKAVLNATIKFIYKSNRFDPTI